MRINNTTIKLVNESLVNDVGNLFTKGKNIGAKTAGLGFIRYSTDAHVIVNMTTDMLNLKNSKTYSNAKTASSKLIQINLPIKVSIKNGESKLSPL